MDAESTAWTATNTVLTPPSSVGYAPDKALNDDEVSHRSSVLWPGSTFIISCAKTGRVVTLQDGHIILDSPRSQGSIRWQCVQTNGLLGFRDPASGCFIGHNNFVGSVKPLRCFVSHHKGYEYFIDKATPNGTYVLLSPHWHEMYPVAVRTIDGIDKLVVVNPGGAGFSAGTEFKFTKV